MSRPQSHTREERELVVETIVHEWCIGDNIHPLQFLFTEEQYAPKGMTMEEFVEKWSAYIRSAAGELTDIIGEDLFKGTWDTDIRT